MGITSVAIIGSFRQHYEAVLTTWDVFTKARLIVTSPKGTSILENGVPFVRFESDPSEWLNHQIQTVALHRILRAQFVFVVAPQGYVGNTTCYEIGRLVQAKQPLYFSDYPIDLPIHIPEEHIIAAEGIVDLIKKGKFEPKSLYMNTESELVKYERDLLLGIYRQDEYFCD